MQTIDMKKVAIELDGLMAKTGSSLKEVVHNIKRFQNMDDEQLMTGYDNAIMFKAEITVDEIFHLMALCELAIATCEFAIKSRMVKK